MPSAKLDVLAHTYNLGTQEAEGEMERQTETQRGCYPGPSLDLSSELIALVLNTMGHSQMYWPDQHWKLSPAPTIASLALALCPASPHQSGRYS